MCVWLQVFDADVGVWGTLQYLSGCAVVAMVAGWMCAFAFGYTDELSSQAVRI